MANEMVKALKINIVSCLEAAIPYFFFMYVINTVLKLDDVQFWTASISNCVLFVWLLRIRTNYWLLKSENKWCPDNRWWYTESKNDAISARWNAVIRQAEQQSKERMQQD
jgi:hypothetical protein